MTWRTPDRLDRQVADVWAVAALAAIALIPFSQSLLSAPPAWIRSGGRLPSLPATPPVPARIAIALGLVGNWAWVLAREG